MRRTFPKEGVKKDKETIRDLKAELRQRDKEIRFLRQELEHVAKPARERKPHVDQKDRSYEDWRKDFLKRHRKEVLGKED